jgi:hypothetical protein
MSKESPIGKVLLLLLLLLLLPMLFLFLLLVGPRENGTIHFRIRQRLPQTHPMGRNLFNHSILSCTSFVLGKKLDLGTTIDL